MAEPTTAVCLKDIEEIAKEKLAKYAYDYYRSGADAEYTLRDNVEAYRRYKLRPRFMRNVSEVDLATTVLGQRIEFPVCISPTAMQRMAHPDGELATAKAASALGTLMTLSTISTSSLEEVAEATLHGLRWFQLYIYKDRKITKKMVERAEASGYAAIVLTVDAPVFGFRVADAKNRFTLPPHLRMANFQTMEKSKMAASGNDSGLSAYVTRFFDSSLTWNDLEWLCSITRLPVITKGVMTAEDAVLSVEHGASAVWVSNHGGRQLDHVPASIDVLPEILEAVKGKVEVYVDGGVRCGTDVVKALALGAQAVFIGRPVVWGLAYKGEEGVKRVLEILKSEVKMAMVLSGCTKVKEITPDLIWKGLNPQTPTSKM